ncbi:hypothetical protein CDL15_Pgr023684 [Punica granatum]|uniref:Major facilitator superfamily (MFS) profile domain-containing protein n=1 Tax=Punica granatum TaxID=22663 RepID=A0A218XMP4_PUNGR|nr:hypothetical protein CDL15_Pgr023684 [Punica granatum]
MFGAVLVASNYWQMKMPETAWHTALVPARLHSTCTRNLGSWSSKARAIVGAFGFLYVANGIGVKKMLIILGVINFLGMVLTFLVPESKG